MLFKNQSSRECKNVSFNIDLYSNQPDPPNPSGNGDAPVKNTTKWLILSASGIVITNCESVICWKLVWTCKNVLTIANQDTLYLWKRIYTQTQTLKLTKRPDTIRPNISQENHKFWSVEVTTGNWMQFSMFHKREYNDLSFIPNSRCFRKFVVSQTCLVTSMYKRCKKVFEIKKLAALKSFF